MATPTTSEELDWRKAWNYPPTAERGRMAADSSGQMFFMVPCQCIILGIIADLLGSGTWLVYEPRRMVRPALARRSSWARGSIQS